MASKFGLAGGIPERRVRPIWDAIDSRQFKNALKQSASLLSKYTNSPYALALILERMGKNEETLSVCLNAKGILLSNDSSNVIDDLTLSTLQIVFQRLDHLDMATSCYEFACGKYPNNLELMMGLFNCYVREYSFVKQQQIAIKMYKIAGEERFLMWAVCSIQLQVCCGDGGEKLFHLAEGLLKKHIASHSLHEPEALSVYITLLEQQSKYGNALEILSGPLGSLMMIEVDKLRLQMFCQNLPLSKELDAQDSMYGEELLSMACDVLVQLFWRTRNLGYLLESIMILEFGLTIRRYVWQYKLLLVHLYSYWNSLPLAYERYKSLDVKNILLETISHHILPQMLASPMWSDLNYLLTEYVKFMDDHFRESADLTFLAYRHRNYSKVIEFFQFKERLQCSNQYLMAKIEVAILQLKQNSNNIYEAESILESSKFGTYFLELSNEIRIKTLTFNEDLKLRPWWTPTNDKNYLLGAFEGVSHCPTAKMYNQIKQTEANVLNLIEKRSVLPRMVYLSIHSASGSVKKNIGVNGSVVDPELSVELKFLLECHAKILEYPFMNAIELVLGVSSGQKSFEEPSSDIIDWINFCIFLNAWNLISHEIMLSDRSDPTSGTWHIVNSLLRKSIIEKINSAGPVVSSPGATLPFLVQLITEPLSWHGLIIQSCVRSLVPSGKRRRKAGLQNNQIRRFLIRYRIQSGRVYRTIKFADFLYVTEFNPVPM